QLPLVEGVGAVEIMQPARAPTLGMYLSAIGGLTGGLSDDLSIFQSLPSPLCRRPMILVERHIDIACRHRNGVRVEGRSLILLRPLIPIQSRLASPTQHIKRAVIHHFFHRSISDQGWALGELQPSVRQCALKRHSSGQLPRFLTHNYAAG